VGEWIEEYGTSNEDSMLRLINCLIRCCGCTQLVSAEDFTDSDMLDVLENVLLRYKEVIRSLGCVRVDLQGVGLSNETRELTLSSRHNIDNDIEHGQLRLPDRLQSQGVQEVQKEPSRVLHQTYPKGPERYFI
jgi:hypothetical protein